MGIIHILYLSKTYSMMFSSIKKGYLQAEVNLENIPITSIKKFSKYINTLRAARIAGVKSGLPDLQMKTFKKQNTN